MRTLVSRLKSNNFTHLQALVQPYLDSRFLVQPREKTNPGLVFKRGISFRSWLSSWLRQLIDNYAKGALPPPPHHRHRHRHTNPRLPGCSG